MIHTYRHSPQATRRQRFTLIELLVVVAIISVLAAMLLPAITKARSRAQRTACLSQLKQFGLATIMYADDNDGYIPDGWSSTPGLPLFMTDAESYPWGQDYHWDEVLKNYGGNDPQMVTCPTGPIYSLFVGFGWASNATLYPGAGWWTGKNSTNKRWGQQADPARLTNPLIQDAVILGDSNYSPGYLYTERFGLKAHQESKGMNTIALAGYARWHSLSAGEAYYRQINASSNPMWPQARPPQ